MSAQFEYLSAFDRRLQRLFAIAEDAISAIDREVQSSGCDRSMLAWFSFYKKLEGQASDLFRVIYLAEVEHRRFLEEQLKRLQTNEVTYG